MASVQRQKDSKGKWRYRVQFYDQTGRRQTIWLGRVSEQVANEVAGHVEHLIDAVKYSTAVPAKTLAWLQDHAPEKAIERLAEAGLCAARQRSTMAAFIEEYINSRKDAAPNTVRNFRSSRQKLIDFFGVEKFLHDISAGDADDWRQWLVNKNYSDSTISKTVKHAKHFFALAKRKGLVRTNPFHHLRAGGEHNESRKQFIDQATIERVIEHAPDAQWRAIIALARFGGLRCPSEILELTWDDVDWANNKLTVQSPKTKKLGKPYRVIPLFPELRKHLEEAHELAPDRARHVITRYRGTNANLRSQFERILKRAGVEPWERLFQNLRASRETELANILPLHVVAHWLGNTEKVASKHYLQVTEAHFEQALRAKNSATACSNVPKTTPQEEAAHCNGSQQRKKPPRVASQVTTPPAVSDCVEVPPRGVEPLFLG